MSAQGDHTVTGHTTAQHTDDAMTGYPAADLITPERPHPVRDERRRFLLPVGQLRFAMQMMAHLDQRRVLLNNQPIHCVMNRFDGPRFSHDAPYQRPQADPGRRG